MQSISIRLPEAQIERLDALVDAGEYASRSEAIRFATRQLTGGEGDV